MGLWFAFTQRVWRRAPCEWGTHHARNGGTPHRIGVGSSHRTGGLPRRRMVQIAVSRHTPLRVVLGEDQPLFREGVVHVLAEAGLDVVGVAADASDLIRKTRAHKPDVVITDIQMPPDGTDDGLRP